MPFKVPTPQSQASGEKRSVDGTSSSQQTKKPKTLPPLTDMVAMESAPKKGNAQRLPAVSPLNICVYKARQLSLFLSLSLSLSSLSLSLSRCCCVFNCPSAVSVLSEIQLSERGHGQSL
jgi:hypothetical protein